ncbi:basic proline-rich protein-like [Mustela erminea]|uniref:basic proline-rich protein-like n=1 Tax=Mustela erminea TaxID=36723 RepID=UPI0013874421|nr:basic proline-rich protein-like [Mustela erminea]
MSEDMFMVVIVHILEEVPGEFHHRPNLLGTERATCDVFPSEGTTRTGEPEPPRTPRRSAPCGWRSVRSTPQSRSPSAAKTGKVKQNANLNTRDPHRRRQAGPPHCTAGGGSDPSAPGPPGPWARFVPCAQRAEPSHPHTKPRLKPAYQQLLPRRPARSPPPPCPPRRRARSGAGQAALRSASAVRTEHAPARLREAFGPAPGVPRPRALAAGRGVAGAGPTPGFLAGPRARAGEGARPAGKGRPASPDLPTPHAPCRPRLPQHRGARSEGSGTPTPRTFSRARTRRLPAAAGPEGTHAGLRGTAPRSSDLHTAGARGVPESRASPAGNTAGTREEHRAGVPHTKRARKSHSRVRVPAPPAPRPASCSGRATSGTRHVVHALRDSRPRAPSPHTGNRRGPPGPQAHRAAPGSAPGAEPARGEWTRQRARRLTQSPRPLAPPRRAPDSGSPRGTAGPTQRGLWARAPPRTGPPALALRTPEAARDRRPPRPHRPHAHSAGANKAGVGPRQVSLRGRVAGTRRRLAGRTRAPSYHKGPGRGSGAARRPVPPSPGSASSRQPRHRRQQVFAASGREDDPALAPPSPATCPPAPRAPCPAPFPRAPAGLGSRPPRPGTARPLLTSRAAAVGRAARPRGPPAPPPLGKLPDVGADSAPPAAARPPPALPAPPPPARPERSLARRGCLRGPRAGPAGRGAPPVGRRERSWRRGTPAPGRAAGADGLPGAGGRGRRGRGAAGDAGEPARAAEAFPDRRRDGSETTPPPRLPPTFPGLPPTPRGLCPPRARGSRPAFRHATRRHGHVPIGAQNCARGVRETPPAASPRGRSTGKARPQSAGASTCIRDARDGGCEGSVRG